MAKHSVASHLETARQLHVSITYFIKLDDKTIYDLERYNQFHPSITTFIKVDDKIIEDLQKYNLFDL